MVSRDCHMMNALPFVDDCGPTLNFCFVPWRIGVKCMLGLDMVDGGM